MTHAEILEKATHDQKDSIRRIAEAANFVNVSSRLSPYKPEDLKRLCETAHHMQIFTGCDEAIVGLALLTSIAVIDEKLFDIAFQNGTLALLAKGAIDA